MFLNLRKDRAEHINHSRCKLTGLEKGVLLTRSATDTNAASPAAQWLGHGAFIITIVCIKPSFYFFILAGKAIAILIIRIKPEFPYFILISKFSSYSSTRLSLICEE